MTAPQCEVTLCSEVIWLRDGHRPEGNSRKGDVTTWRSPPQSGSVKRGTMNFCFALKFREIREGFHLGLLGRWMSWCTAEATERHGHPKYEFKSDKVNRGSDVSITRVCSDILSGATNYSHEKNYSKGHVLRKTCLEWKPYLCTLDEGRDFFFCMVSTM